MTETVLPSVGPETAWPVIDGCLRNPALWRDPSRRPSWAPDRLPPQPKFWYREPGLWLPLSCAIAFNAATDGGFDTDGSHNFSHTCSAGSDRLIVVGVMESTGGSPLVSSVTYAAQALTQIGVSRQAGRWFSLWARLAPASGSNTVTILLSSSDFVYGLAADYTGVRQTGNPAQSNSGTATAASMTRSVTTTDDNAWGIYLGRGISGGVAASTGATQRAIDSFGTFLLMDSNGAWTPTGSHSMAFTQSGADTIGGNIAAFAPAVAAPSGNPWNYYAQQ